MDFVYLLICAVCFIAGTTDAGECCKSYSNLIVSESEKYCSDFCCGSSLVKLECCDSLLLTAPSGDRKSFCLAWFVSPENVYAPILIGLGCIVCIVACCCCCYQCFCKPTPNRTTVMAQPMGPGGSTNVIAMNTTQAHFMGPGQYPQTAQGHHQPIAAPYQPVAAPYPPGATTYPPGTIGGDPSFPPLGSQKS